MSEVSQLLFTKISWSRPLKVIFKAGEGNFAALCDKTDPATGCTDAFWIDRHSGCCTQNVLHPDVILGPFHDFPKDKLNPKPKGTDWHRASIKDKFEGALIGDVRAIVLPDGKTVSYVFRFVPRHDLFSYKYTTFRDRRLFYCPTMAMTRSELDLVADPPDV